MVVMSSSVFALTPSELQGKIQEKEREVAALEAEADAYRKSISETATKANTLKSEIGRMDSQLKQLGYNLSITQKKLEATELKIQELEVDIDETGVSITNRLKEVGQTLQTISEFDQESLLAMLLKSDRISEFFVQSSYLESLQGGLREKIELLRGLRVKLEGDLDVSQETKDRLAALTRSLNNQKKIAQEKKQERASLLAETKNQEQNYQRLLSDTVKKQDAIDREIFELESELRRQIVSSSIPPKNPRLFIIPLDRAYVTQEFGSTRRDPLTSDFYSFHNGIDFGSKTGVGTPVRAAMDGVVHATGNDGRYAYGKWVVIRHANGLTTLYAHLSLTGVAKEAAVSQGSIIGYMGRTGLATGPHLHFTVYASDTFRVENRWFGPLPLGGALNPRDYLTPL